MGGLAQRHPAYSELKALAGILATLSGASVGVITEGANSAGAYLAGAVPHREPGGAASTSKGLSAHAMLGSSPLKAYVLFGGIDPANDLAAGSEALAAADLVIAATTHLPESLRAVAHIVLPIGSFAESSGTFVNAEGRWQSWAGAAKLVGDSRAGVEGAARPRQSAEYPTASIMSVPRRYARRSRRSAANGRHGRPRRRQLAEARPRNAVRASK